MTCKLDCQYGKLENTYSVEHIDDLKMFCPEELKQIVMYINLTYVHQQQITLVTVKTSARINNIN